MYVLIVSTEPPTIRTFSGNVTDPGSNPIPSGAWTCISRTGRGSSVKLVCMLKVDNESVSNVTYSWSTPGGGSLTGFNITANSTGDYTCTASNLCGSSQATTLVSGKGME